MSELLPVLCAAAVGLVTTGWFARRRRRLLGSELNIVITAALLEASLRQNALITIEHVALAISFDPVVERRLAAERIDVARLRLGLVDLLGSTVLSLDEALERATPRVDGRVKSVLRRARARRARFKASASMAIYDAIVDGPESDARRLFTELRDTEQRVSDAIPQSTPYRTGPGVPTAQIRFWNDSRAHMKFVTEMLVEHCGLDPAHARYQMLRVHFIGSSVVQTFTTRAEAEAVADRVAKTARERKVPLRVTSEPIGTV